MRNYAVEDVLPTIDTGATAPPREPETLPDVFGADVVQVDEDGNPIAVDDGSDSDGDGLADSDKTALIIGKPRDICVSDNNNCGCVVVNNCEKLSLTRIQKSN